MVDEIRYVEALYGTGVVSVDDQHRIFFEKINTLLGWAEDPPDRSDALRMLDDMAEFARVHFAHEEGVMGEMRCRASEINKEAHRRFERRIERIRADVAEHGVSAEGSRVLERFLSNWVRQHTMTVDTQLRETVDLT